MDPTTAAPTGQAHSQSHSSTPESAGASPPNRSICNCDTPSDENYLQPIIGCANRKCRPRHYHLRCVGLIHPPRDPLSWLCPTCQPDRHLPPPVCICEDNPPYQFGPMVECTQKDRCATRWFHFPCVYVYPGQDTSQWVCSECSVVIFMQQEREKELEERRARGELDEEQEEHEQRQYVTDGVPGTFINEGTELPRASPEVAPQASPTGAASPRKRKSDDSADDTSHKKVKTSVDAPSAAATPLNTSPQPPTTDPGANSDVAPPPPSESADNVDSGLPAVGASRDTPSPLAADNEASASARGDVSADEDDDDDGDEPESNHYCNRACRRETGAMVACDGADCVGEWFHFACVGLTPGTVPEGEWFCDDCAAVLEERNMKKKGGKGKARR